MVHWFYSFLVFIHESSFYLGGHVIVGCFSVSAVQHKAP